MKALSARLLKLETCVAALIVAAIFLTMTAGAILRSLGQPLLWADELAVHLMVVLAFLSASICIATRSHMAIDLLPDLLGPQGKHRLAYAVLALVIGFEILMLWLCWRWLDPVGLWQAGSGAALAAKTFNFAFVDPTMTLGLRKIWFWAIIPVSSLCGLIHSTAHLLDLPRNAPEVAA